MWAVPLTCPQALVGEMAQNCCIGCESHSRDKACRETRETEYGNPGGNKRIRGNWDQGRLRLSLPDTEESLGSKEIMVCPVQSLMSTVCVGDLLGHEIVGAESMKYLVKKFGLNPVDTGKQLKGN